MEKLSQSRRKFITTLTLLCLSGGLLVRYLKPGNFAKRKVLATADAKSVPFNGALIFNNERLALMRDEGGFYALSLVCTHLGCTVKVTENALSCPCHGSVFDRRGNVTRGPAYKPLIELEAVLRNGMVEIY
jgi:Rieske Fe-S protein